MNKIKLFASASLLHIAAYSVSSYARTIEVNIRAQPLEGAIAQFAQQSGLQVLFPAAGEISYAMAPAVAGTLSEASALDQLLAGSRLEFEFVNSKTVVIRSQKRALGQARRLAANSDNQPSPASSTETAAYLDTQRGNENLSLVKGVPEVLVQGSRSLNADIERSRDDIQPYVVLDRAVIESSGASTVEELLRTRLTMNYVPVSNNQTTQLGVGNESSFALRGLSSAETLILVDGRRPTFRAYGSGVFQPDLNGIPLGAVERIEVLPSTASGIYGGSATGGVINVVMRRDYSGVELVTKLEESSRGDGRNRQIGANGGFSFFGGKTSVVFSASYSDTAGVLRGDRDFAAEYSARRWQNILLNSPSTFDGVSPPLGATTNITSAPVFDPVQKKNVIPNLVLKSGQQIGSSRTSVPYGYGGVSTDGGQALIARAGVYNFDQPVTAQNQGTESSLLGAPIVRFGSITLRQAITSRVEGFVELSGGTNYQNFNSYVGTGTFSIAGGVAGNPFKQNIIVTTPIQLSGRNVTKDETRRALIGVKARLFENWQVGVDYAHDVAKRERISPSGVLQTPAATNAVAAGQLDVTTDPQVKALNWAQFEVLPFYDDPQNSTQDDVTLRLAGPLGTLPAGTPQLSLAVEAQDVSFGAFTSTSFSASTGAPITTSYSKQSTAIRSAYIEAQVPLLSNLRFAQLLELQMAGRYDRYHLHTGGNTSPGAAPVAPSLAELSSVDPTLGLKFKPISSITLRTSLGTGFRPPSLVQLTPGTTRAQANFLNVTDPQRGGERISDTVQYTSGGSPNLKPEHSRSLSAGLILEPTIDAQQIRFSFDWSRIRKTDNITTIAFSQQTVDMLQNLPSSVATRAAPAPGDPFGVGRIIAFNRSYVNVTRADFSSYDYALDYTLPFRSAGVWALSLAASQLTHSRIQLSPTVGLDERAGTYGLPKWNGNALLSWQFENLRLGWALQYADSFWVNTDKSFSAAQNDSRVGSAVYHDFFASYSFPKSGGKWGGATDGLRLRGGIKNVFDRDPRFLATFEGVYDPQISPLQRSYYLELLKQFR